MGLCVTVVCWGENYTLAVHITVEWCDVHVTSKRRVCMVDWFICRQRWCWPRVEGGFKGVSYSVRAWQDVAKIQKNFKGWPLEIPTNLGKFSNGKSLWYFSHVSIFAAKKERTADIYWFLEVAHHHSNMYTFEIWREIWRWREGCVTRGGFLSLPFSISLHVTRHAQKTWQGKGCVWLMAKLGWDGHTPQHTPHSSAFQPYSLYLCLTQCLGLNHYFSGQL